MRQRLDLGIRIAHLLVVAAAACSKPPVEPFEVVGGPGVGTRGWLRANDADGGPRFVFRADGAIESARIAQVTEDQDQFLLVTGEGGGADQGAVLVLDWRGHERSRYRPSAVLPWRDPALRGRPRAGVLVQRQNPVPEQVIPFQYRSRRFLVVGTRGVHGAPCAWVLLEATSPTQLVERVVFWNSGTIHRVDVSPPFLAFCGWNNHIREHGRYTAALAVFELDDLLERLADGTVVRGSSPDAGDGGPVEAAPYRSYVLVPRQRGGRSSWWATRLEEGSYRAETESGLACELDLATGRVTVAAPPGSGGPAAADALQNAVRAWTGTHRDR